MDAVERNPSSLPPTAAPDTAAIARRAFELFVARGCTPGHALDDWLRAEREVAAGLQLRQQRLLR
jgi:hypothetical protein